MRIISLIFVASLLCNRVFAMQNSNRCGTIGKQIRHDGTITYIEVNNIGKRIVVARKEEDGEECFGGYADDIFGHSQSKKFSTYTTAKAEWYRLRDVCEELIKINEDVKNYKKN